MSSVAATSPKVPDLGPDSVDLAARLSAAAPVVEEVATAATTSCWATPVERLVVGGGDDRAARSPVPTSTCGGAGDRGALDPALPGCREPTAASASPDD